ncbi:MAG: hypothetical protein HY063_07230 [Bacteroidetes bacterium]|nr:hypothetical protein [Bacteroidota bacterium]
MKKILFALFVILFFVLQNSCVKDVGPLPRIQNVTPPGFCDTITWTKSIQPIIQTSCINPGCHNPSAGNYSGYDLTTYALVKAKADAGRIQARVIDGNVNGWMPQAGPLPQTQRDKISCWLQAGAPNN